MVYFFGSENISNRTIYNTCMGHNEAFEVTWKMFLKWVNSLQFFWNVTHSLQF
jgi:hypothetical protein